MLGGSNSRSQVSFAPHMGTPPPDGQTPDILIENWSLLDIGSREGWVRKLSQVPET